jgi:hypothetical protein
MLSTINPRKASIDVTRFEGAPGPETDGAEAMGALVLEVA